MNPHAKRPADISAKAIDDYGRLVLKVAHSIVPNPDQAQEIFQETFLRFHTACTREDVIAYPKAWLCRVATNVAFNARRQLRAMLAIAKDTAMEANASRDVVRHLLMDRVRDLAADLPERQRTVIALRNFEGWTFAEIAAQLGCSEGAARSSEYKARRKIRAWMNTV